MDEWNEFNTAIQELAVASCKQQLKTVALIGHLPVHLYQTSPLLPKIPRGHRLMESKRCVEKGVV